MKQQLTPVIRTTVRVCLAGIALTVCLTIAVHAQGQSPKLLRDAARCLATRNYLPPSKAKTLSSGYLLNAKSYPGQKVLYVVVYTRPSRSEGLVFSIFLTNRSRQRIFNIQNNAKFVRSDKENAAFRQESVDFVEPPLWGIWTQEHIARAINQIGRNPTIELRAKDLMKPSAFTQCESYADIK